ETNRKLARDVLRAAGLRTIEAASGAEAITLAARQLPDVILMDMRLPDMRGADVARRLADEPRTAGIPAVAASSLPFGRGGWAGCAGFAVSRGTPLGGGAFPAQVRRSCGADAA